MHSTQIPVVLRPGHYTRPLKLGLDLPSWFWDGLKGIDKDFFLVWHPYRLIWEDIINGYSGKADDPRLVIGQDVRYGAEELWGWVLTDGKGRPIPENKWHLWRLCGDRGWAHVCPITKTAEEDLRFYLDRIHLRAQISAKYGPLGWNKYEEEENAARVEMEAQRKQSMFQDATQENRGLMRRAMENLERGFTAPTNPTVEVIKSGYGGAVRYDRPLTEKESGIVTPWGEPS